MDWLWDNLIVDICLSGWSTCPFRCNTSFCGWIQVRCV